MQVVSFGEVLIDGLPDGDVIGGAPLNVVCHLKRLWVSSGIITKIGKDENGEKIATFLKSEGIDSLLQYDGKRKTGYVEVTLKDGQASYEIKRERAWEFISYKPLLENPDYFVFGSLAMYSENNRKVLEQYVEANPCTQFVCDINLRAPLYNWETIDFCLQKTDVLKINEDEMEYLSQKSNQDDPSQWLSTVYGIDKILLTKGSEGAELMWAGEVYEVPVAEVNKMVDTVGAGDAFMALFLYGILNQHKPKQMLKKASEFAAKICENKGAIPDELAIYQL